MHRVRIIPLDPADARTLDVEVAGRHAADPATDAAWASLRQGNPTLFDGPIILVEPPSASTAKLRGRHATYSHVATTSLTRHHARSLGVKALTLARDRSGTEHALVGLRASSTRIYPGLWELAPAGSVVPPSADATAISLPVMIDALRQEALEEIGIDLATAECTPIALVDDDVASSLDVLFRCVLSPAPKLPRRSCAVALDAIAEYAATEWVPVDRLADWTNRSPDAIAPPTAAIVAWIASTVARSEQSPPSASADTSL